MIAAAPLARHFGSLRDRPYTGDVKPIIGITQGFDDAGRWRPGRRYAYIHHRYAEAVEAAGAVPIHLPIQGDAASLVEAIDGLLLPGGDDFLPDVPYPEDVRFDPAPTAQIDFDRRVLRAADARGLPVLGICYGAQLLALERGGRLHHHLPLDLPASANHVLDEATGRHGLLVMPGTRLETLVPGTPEGLQVVSLHHQAIADPGPALRVAARSPDGVIEAVEGTTARLELGVQWHPEIGDGPLCRAIFRALVRESRAG